MCPQISAATCADKGLRKDHSGDSLKGMALVWHLGGPGLWGMGPGGGWDLLPGSASLCWVLYE